MKLYYTVEQHVQIQNRNKKTLLYNIMLFCMQLEENERSPWSQQSLTSSANPKLSTCDRYSRQ